MVWMSYIIDRGWGRRKKSAADLLETRQPRKPESTFFQQGRERSNHSYPSFGGMRNRATWNLHSPQTSTYWTPVRLEAGMSFLTGGGGPAAAARMSTRDRVRLLLALIRTAFIATDGVSNGRAPSPADCAFPSQTGKQASILLYIRFRKAAAVVSSSITETSIHWFWLPFDLWRRRYHWMVCSFTPSKQAVIYHLMKMLIAKC